MLFLIASFTKTIMSDFQLLMKLDINSMHWSIPSAMAHHSVSNDAHYTTKPFQYVTKSFKVMIPNSSDDGSPTSSKVIFYLNTR